jgi:hypothetical protein
MTENMEPDDFQRAADLRQASDTLMQRLDRLYELESRKRELPPERAEFIRLAREIEDLSRALLYSSGQEVELAEAIHADVKAGDVASDIPIRDTPPRRDAVAILAEWRAAERRLAAAPAGSEDERAARAEIDRYRIEYRQITAPMPDTDPA